MDVNQTYCGDNFTIYTNIASLHCTPETNIILHVNYELIFKKGRVVTAESHTTIHWPRRAQTQASCFPGQRVRLMMDSFFFSFLLVFMEYSCSSMLCQFLLYSKVNQPYTYTHLLFFGFPSHLGHHRALSRAPCAIQWVLISYLFYTQQCIYVNPSLPIYCTPPSPLGIHTFVLYVCVSISALQISLSVPFFQIPHTSDII